MNREPIARAKPALLYLSLNDGSDTRINKEIVTLSRAFTIDFVGVAEYDGHPFIVNRVRAFMAVHGRRRSVVTLARLAWVILRLRRKNHYATVHVINENLYLALWPLLLGQHVVLDVFDSAFLKGSLPGWLVRLAQRFCYALPAKVMVTDEERAALMPSFVRDKLVVLPNYPFRFHGPMGERDPALLRILYVGSLSENRGTALVRRLLDASGDIRVIMAGWLYDEPSTELSRHPRVEWLGTIPQSDIIAQATRCDYVLCHYAPLNMNNIYASPNKIYDAIQAGIAVIINPEVKVAQFVREHGLGVVLDGYEPSDYPSLVRSLREFKAGYRPNPVLASRFIWETVEERLLTAHGAPAV